MSLSAFTLTLAVVRSVRYGTCLVHCRVGMCLPTLPTMSPLFLMASGMARMPVPMFPFNMWIIVSQFLKTRETRKLSSTAGCCCPGLRIRVLGSLKPVPDPSRETWSSLKKKEILTTFFSKYLSQFLVGKYYTILFDSCIPE